jgi:hypothetical protein
MYENSQFRQKIWLGKNSFVPTRWMFSIKLINVIQIYDNLIFLVGCFQYSSLEYCWITLRICSLLFKFVFWRLICDMEASLPLIPFQNYILFSTAHCFFFFHLGHTQFFLLRDHMPLFMEWHLTCHIEGSMITAIWKHLRMFQNCSCLMLNSA